MLENLEILNNLSVLEKQQLSLFCQERTLCAGDVLFSEWDDATAMYILQSGKLEVLKNINGVVTPIWEVSAEEIIWEMALFWEENTRMATAIATQDCILITILAFSIKEITDKHPELLERIKDIIQIRNMKNNSIS